jgi:hypothetical protein
MTTVRKLFACFDRGFALRTAGAVVVIFGLALLARSFPRGSGARIGVSALLGLANGWIVLLCIQAIRRLDELHQRIQLEAIAIAFAITAVAVTTLAYVERAGARLAGWELWIWPAMAVLWAGGAILRARRYR